MGSRVAWVGLLIAALAATLWWAVESRVRAPRAPGAIEATPPRRDDASQEPDSLAVAAAGEETADFVEAWTLTGRVLDAATDAPWGGYRVLVGPRADVRCDADGHFEAELQAARDPLGAVRTFHVFSTDGALVASLVMPLQLEVVLRVERAVVLHGRVVDPLGTPVPAVGVNFASISGPFASTDVDPADGTFRAPVAADRIDGSFHTYLGERTQTQLEISKHGRVPVLVTVEADTPATWTLP